MTKHYEVTKLFHRNKPLTVCAISYYNHNHGLSKTVDVLVNDCWESFIPPENLTPEYHFMINEYNLSLLTYDEEFEILRYLGEQHIYAVLHNSNGS